jgi:hypothetical protein
MDHEFSAVIRQLLGDAYGDRADQVFDASELLQYLNIKTRSASRGSKSRGSFANHYALYVLIEDYVAQGFADSGRYADYEGARFTQLFRRQRELPFGSKLQNHALNSRLNEEFKKYFPTCDYSPILRDAETNRYWVNENLLKISVGGAEVNIARPILSIIDAYVDAKRDSFDQFITQCVRLGELQHQDMDEARDFIASLVAPNSDARVFEIASYAILKAYYSDQSIYWGWERDAVEEDALTLYKTGRTNANDGGIDFVMKPLGRFFQVTETVDVRKYFLDIDKIQRYPLTFVVKTLESDERVLAAIRAQAGKVYVATRVVDRLMECIEEVVNIPTLLTRFDAVVASGHLSDVVAELIGQSRVEFNVYEEDGADISSSCVSEAIIDEAEEG